MVNQRLIQDEVNASNQIKAQKKREEAPIWKTIQKERQHIRTKPPKDVQAAYQEFWSFADPTPEDFEDKSDFSKIMPGYQSFKDEYVPLFEEAYFKYKGEIPLDFFLEFEDHELQTMVHTIPEDTMWEINNIWQSRWQAKQYQMLIDIELEKRIAEMEPAGGIWEDFLDFVTPGDLHAARNQGLTDVEKARLRKQIEEEWSAPPSEVEGDGFWTSLNKGLPLIMGPIGWVGLSKGMTATDTVGYTFDKALGVAAPILGELHEQHLKGNENLIGDIMEARFTALEEQRQRDLEELEASQGYVDSFAREQLWQDNKVAWDKLDEDDKQFYLDVGGDEVTAMGIFFAERNDELEVEEQLANYSEQYNQELRDQVQVLQETSFEDKDALLNGLSAWGDFTGDLAVGSMLLFTIDELPSSFDDYFAEIQKYEHSPAKLMGWDGTALGIGFDFGMMTLFDPTTYMFGGGAAAATGRGTVRTQRGAMRILDSAEQVSKRIEIEKALLSPQTGIGELISMSGLDGIGQAQLLGLQEVVAPSLAKGAWRTAAPQATEVPTRLLAELIPAQHGANVAQASKAIGKNGWSRPVTLQVSSSGRVAVKQGDLSGLVAAVDNGWGTTPVQWEFVDDGLKAYSDDQIRMMEDLALPEPNRASPLNSPNAQMGLLSDFQAAARDSDTVLGTIERGGKTYQVRHTTVQFSGDAAPAGGGIRDLIPSAETAGRQARMEARDFRELWYVTDDTGEVVAGYNGYSMTRAPNDNLKGIMHEALKVSEDADNSFLPRLMERASADDANFSTAGRGFLERAVRDRLNNRLDGQDLKSVWGDAAKTPSPVEGPQNIASLLDQTALMGGTDTAEAIKNIYKGQLLRNGRLEDMTYNVIARGLMDGLKKLSGMTDNQYIDYVKRYMTSRSLSRTFNTASGHAMDDATDYLARLWGSDTDSYNAFMTKLYETQQGSQAKHIVLRTQEKRIKELEQAVEELQTIAGRVPDQLDDVTRAEMGDVLAQRNPVLDVLDERTKELEALRGEAAKSRAKLPNNSNIFKVLDDAIDEYNRKYLASMPEWKPYLDSKGLVPREILRKGRLPKGAEARRTTERSTVKFSDEVDQADALSKTHKKIASSDSAHYDLGVSALDLAVAREMGGAKYMKYTQSRNGHALREAGHMLHNAWIIDKVIRPATAAVVTIDEAMRILHLYGTQAFTQYMMDKVYFMEARTVAAFRGNNPLRREAVGRGASGLSPKAQERIRRLNDWGAKIKADERTFFDQQGIGYVDISTNDPMYRTYARQWTDQFVNDSGFRAFMGGPEDFKRWWDESPDAARLRDKSINMRKGGTPPTQEQVYQGWETIWKALSSQAKKDGVLKEFTDAWKGATQEAGRVGRPVPLPDSVYDHFIPVRGAQKIGGNAVNRLTDAFFDRFFMDPVNYRRGFIAEMVRKTEMKRIRQFYADQNKMIVPDAQLQDMMGVAGYRTGNEIGTPEAMAHFWADSQYVPESYVAQMIERTVHKEVENMLYVWNMGSRAGAQSKVIFPFGKPYADMMGFWGREMLKKPILRGVVNNDNYLSLQAAADALPINPKTGALLSRMAATDFHVDRGWIPEEGDVGEGLLPGSSSTDLSPLFFLPTEGDDILGSTLPGLGYIPLAFLDIVLNTVGPDPVEDPIGYNEWVDNISEGLPYFEFQTGGTLSRLAGGGTISTLFSAAVDAQGYFTGDTNFNITSEFGDIGREIRRAREVSVLLSDPEILADIAQITDPHLLDLYLTSIVDEANRNASASHFGEVATRWALPAKSKYDVTGAELQDVWIQAGAEFKDILNVEPQISLDTQEGKRQYADDIRSRFFDLEGWERDMLIAANPALAVNLVSSWDWTPKAINANFPGSDVPYSTGGLPEDLLRHDWYVDNGYVRPIQPAHRARLILGQVSEARDNSIKRVYESVVGDVNEIIWNEYVSQEPDLMGYLELLQEQYGADMGTKDARHIWNNWSTSQEFILRRMEEEGEVFDDDNPRSLGFPEDYKSWSTTWTGYEDTTQKFGNVEDITLPPDAEKIVSTLGLDFEPGMNGDQFHRMLADHLATNESLADGVYRASWDQYTTERLSTSNSVNAQRSKALYDPQNDATWRREFDEWMTRVDNLKEQWATAPQGVPNGLRQEVVDEFNGIVAGSKDRGNIAWDVIWKGYENVFGSRDWTPPEPLSPFEEREIGEGEDTATVREKRPTTRTPYIHSVVDGDTLIFSEPHDPIPRAVRLLGVSAAEYGYDPEQAEADSERLREAIRQARRNGDTIYLVTDPDRFVTNTDRYGRMLAWLWIGDEPFYFKEEMNPKFTPSGDNE